MTTQQKIDRLKGLTIPPRAPAKIPGAFDVGLFSPDAVLAINAANARGKFLPSRPPSEEPDESTDADDDDSANWHAQQAQTHLGMCDEAMCERAPTDGSPDHLALAAKHIQEAVEMRARGGRLRDIISQNSHHTRVRFETQTRE